MTKTIQMNGWKNIGGSVPYRSLSTEHANEAVHLKSALKPESYTKPFIDFISKNPTVFHAIDHFSSQLTASDFTKLSERELWSEKLEAGGKYFFSRNGSGLIAFTIGENYKVGNGVAMVASHIDALTAKVKPVSTKPTKQGFLEVGVGHYGGALNQTWLDRDLGIGGRVFVKDKSGKIEVKLVKLNWPIGRIPSIAPHFGLGAEGQPNRETRMIPIIGLDNSDLSSKTEFPLGGVGSFASTQPAKLFEVIAGELNIQDCKVPSDWKRR